MDSVTFDFNNMIAHAVGAEQGISPSDLEGIMPELASAHAAVEGYRQKKTRGFLDLPYETASWDEAQFLADDIAGKFDNFVVLGIGGSALGNIALHNALRHPFYNLLPRTARKKRPRIFVEDNVDPDHIRALFETLDIKKTCFNVITKSGDTVETMSSYFLAREKVLKVVGKKRAAAHFVATTSPHRGMLLEIAQEEGYRTLPIPENVGGRFSVLSSVGLLSAAVAGISVKELCLGAQVMDRVCQNNDGRDNPALLCAGLHYLAYGKGKRISVLMPYAQGLKEIADWYAQLWAESLGKRLDRAGKDVFVGPTPVKTLGVTDQHSQLQLYQEGPYDKIVTVLTVSKFRNALKIPQAFPKKDTHYLSGHTFQELIQTEQKATQLALTKASRMNACIELSRVSPATVGMLLYFFQMQTAYAGELFNINAFDQPGVEAGKKFAYGILGRKGYEAKRSEFIAAPKPQGENILRVDVDIDKEGT